MWPRFGIKIGNSTLCVASAKEDRKLEVIANKHGDRVSQACLLFVEGDGGGGSGAGDEIEIGLTAKQKMLSKGTSTVCNNFQLFSNNLSEKEINDALQHIPCGFNKETLKYELQENDENSSSIKSFSPFEVCVEFFKGSFELARQCHLSEDHPRIVLSIPYYYKPECWRKLAEAAENAGFKVAQVIAEPTAAVLAYELAENTSDNVASIPVNGMKKVLCIKTGGLLTSFTLYEVGNGLYTMLNSCGPFYLGGKQFTDVLIDFIGKEFYKKYRLNPQDSRRSMAKIRTAADNCKHILTTLASTQIYVDSLMDGIDFCIQMSRARFENLIQPVLNEFIAILTSSLEKLEITSKEINEIVLMGGTMKIPRLQTVITNYFPEAKLNNTFPPDEVVAIGCARQCLYINPDNQELHADMNCTCTTGDIYIWHDDNASQEQLFIKKGTLLPNKIAIDVERSSKQDNSSQKIPNNLEDDYEEEEKETIFHIRCDDKIEKIQLIGVKAVQGIFKLTANIEEKNGWPVVKLSCF